MTHPKGREGVHAICPIPTTGSYPSGFSKDSKHSREVCLLPLPNLSGTASVRLQTLKAEGMWVFARGRLGTVLKRSVEVGVSEH